MDTKIQWYLPRYLVSFWIILLRVHATHGDVDVTTWRGKFHLKIQLISSERKGTMNKATALVTRFRITWSILRTSKNNDGFVSFPLVKTPTEEISAEYKKVTSSKIRHWLIIGIKPLFDISPVSSNATEALVVSVMDRFTCFFSARIWAHLSLPARQWSRGFHDCSNFNVPGRSI